MQAIVFLLQFPISLLFFETGEQAFTTINKISIQLDIEPPVKQLKFKKEPKG
jgi:hypothetical protein